MSKELQSRYSMFSVLIHINGLPEHKTEVPHFRKSGKVTFYMNNTNWLVKKKATKNYCW